MRFDTEITLFFLACVVLVLCSHEAAALQLSGLIHSTPAQRQRTRGYEKVFRASSILNAAEPAPEVSRDFLLSESTRRRRSAIREKRSMPVLTPGEAIIGLYTAFNDRNATAAASFLDDECV